MKYHRPEGGQVLALYLYPSRGSQRLVFRAPALHRYTQILHLTLYRVHAYEREIILYQVIQTRQVRLDLGQGLG